MAKKQSPTPREPGPKNKRQLKLNLNADNVRKWIKSTFYAVWAVVGLIVIGAIIVSAFTDNSLLGMVAGEQAQPAPAGQTPPPQQGPTPEQLECVGAVVGPERLAELQQGAPTASEEEAATIQQCLQGGN